MVDIIPYVNKLLKPIAQIELSYNNISADMPLIVITETANDAEMIIDGEDAFSGITIQLDIYHFTDRQVRETACAASNIMTKAGFRRKLSSAVPEQNLKRVTLIFSCGIDEKSGRIFSGPNTV